MDQLTGTITNNHTFLAHSATSEHPEGQPLKEHLENVSKLAEEFCRAFGAEDDGRLCGLYHDVGKYSARFQQRLAGSNVRVDHSSAGAFLLFKNMNIPAAICIAGHHGGLPDLGTKYDLDSNTFMSRINRATRGDIEDFSEWSSELPDIPLIKQKTYQGTGNYYFIKMLFSALTDADWLDTEAYFDNKKLLTREGDLHELRERLDAFIHPWWNAGSDLNKRRCRILRAAIDHGNDEPGIFSMTVPTGGGKTISSMAFALHHAVLHGMRRIIYVIPYCSILEQTEAVFASVFGRDNIIAHYSGAEFSYDEDSTDERAFSAENWEAPIILTTAVQFFESVFSNKPNKNRKLHNVARSVIVFDEAQMLPVPFIKPCLDGICRLSEFFGCSSVLCTATQPSVGRILDEISPGIRVRELCPEPEKMYLDFRRVVYVDEGYLSDEELVNHLRAYLQVLCIVNSRRQAQQLYRELSSEEMEGVYHLSTMMIPRDRKEVLGRIRKRLIEGEKCRVISTSLIEAGVDVDFPAVYRAVAGLDSIIQAGGRCNREGKRPLKSSVVHIFRSDAKPSRMIEKNVAAAERVLNGEDSIDSPSSVRSYFDFLLYTLKGGKQLDEKEILPAVRRLEFESIAKRFRLIDSADYTIYIPVEENKDMIERLLSGRVSRNLMRKLNQFSVQVYKEYFDQIYDNGELVLVSETAGILMNTKLYSRETGLPFEVEEQSKAIFV